MDRLIYLFGALLMSGGIVVLLGITLLLEGILNFSTVITAVKIVKNQRPDVIEVDDFEERKD